METLLYLFIGYLVHVSDGLEDSWSIFCRFHVLINCQVSLVIGRRCLRVNILTNLICFLSFYISLSLNEVLGLSTIPLIYVLDSDLVND